MKTHATSHGTTGSLIKKLEAGLTRLEAQGGINQSFTPGAVIAEVWKRSEISLKDFLSNKVSIEQVNTDSFYEPRVHAGDKRTVGLNTEEKIIFGNWLKDVACHPEITAKESWFVLDAVSEFLGSESATLAPTLVGWLDRPEDFNKRAILEALGKLTEKSSYEKIAKFIEDPDRGISVVALAALNKFDGEVSAAAIESCINVLTEWDPDSGESNNDSQLVSLSALLVKAGGRAHSATDAMITVIKSMLPDRKFPTDSVVKYGKYESEVDFTYVRCGAALPECLSALSAIAPSPKIALPHLIEAGKRMLIYDNTLIDDDHHLDRAYGRRQMRVLIAIGKGVLSFGAEAAPALKLLDRLSRMSPISDYFDFKKAAKEIRSLQ